MEDVLLIVVFIVLLNSLVSGMRMGRHMTFLFKELKEKDPELWKDLARPGVGIFDTSGSITANLILMKGSERLERHSILSDRYKLARKWWLRFNVVFLAIPISVFIVLINKNL